MMILNDADSRRLKELQIGILKEFLHICGTHHFRYFFLGGSCLGAVRHQGFIPWDDDIDIGMPREDYERFLETAEKELSFPYFLQTARTDPDYPLNFAKIRHTQTTFIESSVAHLQIHHGIYLDIFPLDGYSPSPLFQANLKRLKWGVEQAYHIREWRSGFKKLFVRACTCTLKDYRTARDHIEKAVRKRPYDSSDTVINYFGAWGKKELFPKEVFGEGSVGLFEGIEVMLPADPDRYCRQLYGNYMAYPPVEARVSHHHCDIIDLEKSYLEYRREQ